MENLTFGECLKSILLELNISMSRLAKHIHVDSSLVNRWVHGNRIPSYNSFYIENIAEYLSKNVYNEIQVNNINSILLKQGINVNNESMYEKIKIALLKAQGYSFQDQKDKLKYKKINLKEENDKLYQQTNAMEYLFQSKGLHEIVELSSNDKIIFGYDKISKIVIETINNTVTDDVVENKLIYMTYNNNFPKSKQEIIDMRECFLKAIDKGWKIIILLRIDDDINRLISFFKFANSLLLQNGLSIYYFTQYGLVGAERETFLISHTCALSSFANSKNLQINTAFLLKSYDAVAVFEEYFSILIKNNYRQLVKVYSNNEYIDYYNLLIDCGESLGNLITYKSYLSIILFTEQAYLKFLKKCDVSDNMQKIAFKYYKRQCASFRRNIKYYEFKEVYLIDIISDLIKRQELYLYYYAGIKKIRLNAQDIVELLENIINNGSIINVGVLKNISTFLL